MSRADDLAMVIALACLIEDRTNQEQLALLRVATRVDNERNAVIVTNRRTGPPSELASHVRETRDITDDQKYVDLPAKEIDRWDRQVREWTLHHPSANPC